MEELFNRSKSLVDQSLPDLLQVSSFLLETEISIKPSFVCAFRTLRNYCAGNLAHCHLIISQNLIAKTLEITKSLVVIKIDRKIQPSLSVQDQEAFNKVFDSVSLSLLQFLSNFVTSAPEFGTYFWNLIASSNTLVPLQDLFALVSLTQTQSALSVLLTLLFNSFKNNMTIPSIPSPSPLVYDLFLQNRQVLCQLFLAFQSPTNSPPISSSSSSNDPSEWLNFLSLMFLVRGSWGPILSLLQPTPSTAIPSESSSSTSTTTTTTMTTTPASTPCTFSSISTSTSIESSPSSTSSFSSIRSYQSYSLEQIIALHTLLSSLSDPSLPHLSSLPLLESLLYPSSSSSSSVEGVVGGILLSLSGVWTQLSRGLRGRSVLIESTPPPNTESNPSLSNHKEEEKEEELTLREKLLDTSLSSSLCLEGVGVSFEILSQALSFLTEFLSNLIENQKNHTIVESDVDVNNVDLNSLLIKCKEQYCRFSLSIPPLIPIEDQKEKEEEKEKECSLVGSVSLRDVSLMDLCALILLISQERDMKNSSQPLSSLPSLPVLPIKISPSHLTSSSSSFSSSTNSSLDTDSLLMSLKTSLTSLFFPVPTPSEPTSSSSFASSSSSSSPASLSSKVFSSEDVELSSELDGRFSELVKNVLRLLGNLVHRCPFAQESLRTSGCFSLVLSHTHTNFSNPLAREWALLCVRNACEGCEENQTFVSSLTLKREILVK